jgi:hypothetical protein
MTSQDIEFFGGKHKKNMENGAFWRDLFLKTNNCSSGVDESFLSAFGCRPKDCDVLWGKIFDGKYPRRRVHLLWMLHFLRRYEVFEVLHLNWDVTSRHFARTIWKMVLFCDKRLKTVLIVSFIFSDKHGVSFCPKLFSNRNI